MLTDERSPSFQGVQHLHVDLSECNPTTITVTVTFNDSVTATFIPCCRNLALSQACSVYGPPSSLLPEQIHRVYTGVRQTTMVPERPSMLFNACTVIRLNSNDKYSVALNAILRPVTTLYHLQHVQCYLSDQLDGPASFPSP